MQSFVEHVDKDKKLQVRNGLSNQFSKSLKDMVNMKLSAPHVPFLLGKKALKRLPFDPSR